MSGALPGKYKCQKWNNKERNCVCNMFFYRPFCSYHNLCNVLLKTQFCSVLGKGATGAVFQGVNKHNGETVAVIVIIIVVVVVVVVVVMGEQGLCRAEKMLR